MSHHGKYSVIQHASGDASGEITTNYTCFLAAKGGFDPPKTHFGAKKSATMSNGVMTGGLTKGE